MKSSTFLHPGRGFHVLLVLLACVFCPAFGYGQGQTRIVVTPQFTAVVNPNVAILPRSDSAATEWSISVHPSNPDVLFASANTQLWPFVHGRHAVGWFVSTDGGNEWSGSYEPPNGAMGDDPAAAIGETGQMYLSHIGPVVSKTTNNGATWSTSVISIAGYDDKDHSAVDYPNVYLAFSFGERELEELQPSPLKFVRSTDDGVTWPDPMREISGGPSVGVNLQIGLSGEIYAVWSYGAAGSPETGIGFNVSYDAGQNWSGERTLPIPVNGIGGYLKAGYGNSRMRVNSFPSLAVDKSNGERRGWMYLVWTQRDIQPAGHDPDIALSRSTDGGVSWSDPVRVNDDAFDNGKDQWFPWATVDPATGALDIVFYDSRNDPDNLQTETYVAHSIDGGSNSVNMKISDQPFTPLCLECTAYYHGDYIGITSLSNNAWPCWMDNRDGHYLGYVSKITYESPYAGVHGMWDPDFAQSALTHQAFLRWPR